MNIEKDYTDIQKEKIEKSYTEYLNYKQATELLGEFVTNKLYDDFVKDFDNMCSTSDMVGYWDYVFFNSTKLYKVELWLRVNTYDNKIDKDSVRIDYYEISEIDGENDNEEYK